MDFAGLLGKFRVNRPLTEQEKLLQLKQRQHLDVEPHYQMSVIKMNSSYLESVDKWYASNGLITQVMLIAISILLTLLGILLHAVLTKTPTPGRDNEYTWVLISLGILSSPVLAAAGWALCKEAFCLTHYPMRFNRRTRMVHIFRTNGTILSVPWDQIFFTLAPVDAVYRFWNIMGHVLAEDKNTVLESFTLSVSSTGDAGGILTMRSHWEFVRRYMEEGPASVTEQVEFCLPISDRRESLSFALHRLLANTSTTSAIFWPILITGMIFEVSTLPFRYFAMRTSKIPRWPDEIDAACVVDNNDPYAIAGAPNADRVAVFRDAAKAAGVGFKAPPKNPLHMPTAVPVTAAQASQASQVTLASPSRKKKRKK